MMTHETGKFGFPLVESQYTVCSDVYGHNFNIPQNVHMDDDFLDAVQAGYDNGSLHDNGHLVVNKHTGKLAFLVTVRIEDDTIIPARMLSELSAIYDVGVHLMEVPDIDARLPGYQLVTAQFNRIEQFKLAYQLVPDIVAAEEAARNKVENLIVV